MRLAACRLAGRADLVDLVLADGRIVAIEPSQTGAGGETIEAGGRVVTGGLVEAHTTSTRRCCPSASPSRHRRP